MTEEAELLYQIFTINRFFPVKATDTKVSILHSHLLSTGIFCSLCNLDGRVLKDKVKSVDFLKHKNICCRLSLQRSNNTDGMLNENTLVLCQF